MDRVGRVWEYEVGPPRVAFLPVEEANVVSQTPTITASPDDPLPVPTTLYTLNLHTAPIASVRSRPLPSSSSTPTSSPHVLTAGWDGLVGVWDLTPGVNEGEPEVEGGERKKKRRKHVPGVVIGKVRSLSSSSRKSRS